LNITTEQWDALQQQELDALCLGDSTSPSSAPTSGLIFPGAFNPLHAGHRNMASTAAELLGKVVEFEISILNVDKPPLEHSEALERAAQFSVEDAVWLTRSATFLEKSHIFPGSQFIVGVDTILRIANPRYSGGNEAHLSSAIEQIAKHDCRFFVFGRKTDTGFQTLDDLVLPPRLRKICDGVSQAQFQHDISSTELRDRS